MSYFVTGATGFIGRYLVERLLARGDRVFVLVRPGSLAKFEALREFWETICAFSIEWPAGEGLANALPFAFDINSVRNAMAASRALVQGDARNWRRYP